MTKAYADKEIWFLTGSQDLYGEETLKQVAEQSQAVARGLDDAAEVPANIVWKPVLKDSASIRRAMLDANADDNVLGVITWMHTFSPAKMWIAGLEELVKPLLHLHTQANVELPWDTIDFDFMNLNQAAHGDREYAYILSRLGNARKTVVGHVSDPRVISETATWVRAAAGLHAAKNLKVARFGDNMRFVAVTEGDKTEAEIKLGVQVNTWGVNELIEKVDAATDAQIDALVAEYEAQYEVVPELQKGGERHQSLRDAAAIEVGLRTFLTEGGFGAFTDNFEDLGTLKQLPGIAVQRLMAEGYGFGGEGDWKTAVLVHVAGVMGRGLPGGASLMEDYTYDLTPGEGQILGAHMLEVAPSLSSKKARVEIHPLGIGGKDDPVRLVFTADPGPAIVVAMSDIRTRFRLVANVVENVETPDLPNLPVGRAVWKPAPNLPTSAACWMAAGAAHHTVMSNAIGIDVFRDFAAMAGIELVTIDESTTVHGFHNELKWNQVYHHINGGL
ncbi:L-arabinose isomerase [Microbacterium amylolyticum]|uniref:L-arabinose isomerase n=1 Tax=Microbacterium amylolyticum TaxID=936337 RepID=A0ABS4ZF53_9MICO|nr:L-arabinose isomerase [Microbacterium amylolyticum]MBP2435894.1 L-arabinose isomerase [Microbacterium amylolyticum]